MEELHKIVKKKYKDFDITPQHLGQVIRDNNITRKRTRHEHYPKERYGKPTDIKKELKTFYNEVGKYSLDKIISLDETSIQPSMILEFSKCELGKRCVIKKYLTDTPLDALKRALEEASKETDTIWNKLGELNKLSITASEKVTQLEKDKENQALEKAKIDYDVAKKHYNEASKEFTRKKTLKESLELSSKFTSENIDFLKRYKGKLG